MSRVSFLHPMLAALPGRLALRNVRNERELAHDLIAAFDSNTRRTGLLGRDVFPDGSAMLIAPSNAVHTFFMRFAIDVAFVSKDGRVLKLRPNIPPWRMAAALRAFAVIEMPVGALAHADTQSGDVLQISGS